MSTENITPATETNTVFGFKVKTQTRYEYTDMEKYQNFMFQNIKVLDEKDFQCQLQIVKNITRRNHELMTIFLETSNGQKIELDDIANMSGQELNFCQNLLEQLDPWGIFSKEKKAQKNSKDSEDFDFKKANNENAVALITQLYSEE